MRYSKRPISERSMMWAIFIFGIVVSAPSVATADALGRLLKRTAGVADDVPLNSTDDVLTRLKNLPTFRPSDEALKTAGQTALRNPEDLRAAAIMVDGAKRLDDAIPDLALRSDLVRRGGNDAIQAAGMRADAAVDLLYLDRYLARGDLDLAALSRRPTMADFAAVVADDARWKFWQTYVVPNKKLWAGGAALAAYLVAPEMWHDAAGKITEKGLELAGDLGGELLGGVLRGLREGGKSLGEKVANNLSPLASTSFVGWLGMLAIIAILTILLLATLRQRAFALVKRLVVGNSSNPTDADSF